MSYSNILDMFLTSPMVAFLLGSIVAYFAMKRIRTEVISLVYSIISEEKASLKTELEAWINSETGQKAIYGIGAIAGSGIMAGTGIQKKSGKFSWQNLIGEIAGEWIRKRSGLGGERKTLNSDRSKDSIPNAK